MPRTVGETDDFGVIKANYGRFGPYIQYGKKYVSLKEITPEEVTLNEALTLIKAKENSTPNASLKPSMTAKFKSLMVVSVPTFGTARKRAKVKKHHH
ncbi:DNA topoisomerase I (EC [uncultured Gammaproteobacteria bacterium]|nr:DNA topoisomerase I (EC [uncultured Gammaproteobacteria bacterium]